MRNATLPHKADWDVVLPAAQARSRALHQPLVAIDIQWPSDVKAARAILPGVVKLAIAGIRGMGLVLPHGSVTVTGHEFNGLPLVRLEPQWPRERDPEYLTDAEALAAAHVEPAPVHTKPSAHKRERRLPATSMAHAFAKAGLA